MLSSSLRSSFRKISCVHGAGVRGFATYKSSTGLVGLLADPNGRENLNKLAKEVLQSIKRLPATYQYRTDCEKIYTYYEKTTREMEDVYAIEQEIGRGQIEEVIEACKDELKLIDYAFENKMWDLVEEGLKEADHAAMELADTIEFTNRRNGPNTMTP